ncbi:UDP-glucuronosyltransferase 2A1-like isoform X1 [Amazona aestiva]|uniref:UDP-glucuronosyltransferase 2A1-like isoform X1 n=1 Tax=Amazona aestiva TaxID=12930 RepID=A0A0Q3R2Q0_AMAAE|nr:UDP-glucuronosyltransferase 2A1-like isoform X1 [Amazona aestiva]
MATKATGSKKSLQLLLFQVALVGPVFCGNVLVWPTEGSHWLNVKMITKELIRRGHSVTVLASNASVFITPRDDAMEKFEVYNVPFEKDTVETLIEEIVALWLNNRPTALTFWQFYTELGKMFKNLHEINRLMCDAVLTNHELMAHLQGSGYDLLLTDPVTLCGDLVALKLSIPFMYSLRFSPASTVERHCGKMPAPPSYAPAALSELTDKMSFGERIKNILSYHLQDFVFQSYWGQWDTYYSKVLGQAMAGKEVAVLWLLAVLGYGSGGNVLVWPADNSHWLNMEYILKELVVRGHEVTVLMPSCFLIFDGTQSSPFQFEVVEVPITKKEMATMMEEAFYFLFYEERQLPFWQVAYKMTQMLHKIKNTTETICNEVLKNQALMQRLRASNFDVLLADPLTPSGELIAEKLGIPFVYTIRFSVGNTVERLCGTLPAPPSYVPATLSGLVDRMSFLERLKNIFSYTAQDFMYHYLTWGSWDQYYTDVLGKAAFTSKNYICCTYKSKYSELRG